MTVKLNLGELDQSLHVHLQMYLQSLLEMPMRMQLNQQETIVVMDTLSMAVQVSSVCKSVYAHLRNIAQIRCYLTQDATATLIHSLVTSRLDNMNSLLHGLPDYQLNKLQYI